MSSRLRVLYLTHHGPWPATSGGRLRDAALIPEVARLADIEVWAISRSPEVDRAAVRRAPDGVEVRIFEDESPRRSFPTRHSAAARAALAERMATAPFDVIHVEGHYLVHLLPHEVRHRAVVVEHNVESHLLRQRAAHRGLNPDLVADIDALARVEEDVWGSVGMIVALSAEDGARIRRRVPDASLGLSTDGADHVSLVSAADTRKPAVHGPTTFGYLANYGYPPNADTLDWLLDEIVPALRGSLPDSRLLLAGSNLKVALADRQVPTGVDARGWIDDLTEFWNDVDVFLCPLRIGGGIKVKLIEAVRSGTLSVSTSVGLEGLPTSVRQAIVRADGARDLVSAAARLSTDEVLQQRQRGHLARAQKDLPTWEAVARTLHGYWLNVTRPALGGIARGT